VPARWGGRVPSVVRVIEDVQDPEDLPAAAPVPTGPADPAGWAAQRVERLREGLADRVPPVLRPGRPGVPRAAALAALIIAVVLSAVLVLRARADPGEQEAFPARAAGHAPSGVHLPAAGAAAAPSGAVAPASVAASGSGALLVVDVTGRVRRPGLVRLPAGSRVWDAVLAAGGAVPGARLDGLNLARRVTDGEQVIVPAPGDPVPAPAAAEGGAGGSATTSVIDLNTATAAQLDALPGVGPVLAARIADWRARHGRFSRVDELGEVGGIGPKLLDRLRPLVRV